MNSVDTITEDYASDNEMNSKTAGNKYNKKDHKRRKGNVELILCRVIPNGVEFSFAAFAPIDGIVGREARLRRLHQSICNSNSMGDIGVLGMPPMAGMAASGLSLGSNDSTTQDDLKQNSRNNSKNKSSNENSTTGDATTTTATTVGANKLSIHNGNRIESFVKDVEKGWNLLLVILKHFMIYMINMNHVNFVRIVIL